MELKGLDSWCLCLAVGFSTSRNSSGPGKFLELLITLLIMCMLLLIRHKTYNISDQVNLGLPFLTRWEPFLNLCKPFLILLENHFLVIWQIFEQDKLVLSCAKLSIAYASYQLAWSCYPTAERQLPMSLELAIH